MSQAEEDLDGRRLPRAVRSEEAEDLASGDLKVKTVQGSHFPPRERGPEGLREAFSGEDGGHGPLYGVARRLVPTRSGVRRNVTSGYRRSVANRSVGFPSAVASNAVR